MKSIHWRSELETLIPFPFHQRHETIYIANISSEKTNGDRNLQSSRTHGLHEHEVGDDVALRIKLTRSGVQMQPDTIRPGDEAFDHNGKVVLVLDQQTSQLLSNKTIDLMTDDDGPHLTLD